MMLRNQRACSRYDHGRECTHLPQIRERRLVFAVINLQPNSIVLDSRPRLLQATTYMLSQVLD